MSQPRQLPDHLGSCSSCARGAARTSGALLDVSRVTTDPADLAAAVAAGAGDLMCVDGQELPVFDLLVD